MTILDDRDNRESPTTGNPTGHIPYEGIWGPYRFRGDGADRDVGRSVAPFALQVGSDVHLQLEETGHPHDTEWRRRWAGEPLRLELWCHREGHPPWRVSLKVDMPSRMP